MSAPPATTQVEQPRGLPELGLVLLRPAGARWLRRRYDVRVRGEHKVPEDGPVIFASNHIGWLDGPLLIACTPRPAHALVKSEAFEGRTGRLLRLTGQICLDRARRDVGALRTAADALAAGQAVVVYPEGVRGDGEVHRMRHGVTWLALVSGAPVVPVAIFGTRSAGGHAESRPARGARLDIVYGEPIAFPPRPWPRTREMLDDAGAQIHEHLRGHVRWAARTGKLELPGPLPKGSPDV